MTNEGRLDSNDSRTGKNSTTTTLLAIMACIQFFE
jgi:hypothetical protein